LEGRVNVRLTMMEHLEESAETRRKRIEKHRTRPKRLGPSVQGVTSEIPSQAEKEDYRDGSPSSINNTSATKPPLKRDTKKKKFRNFLQTLEGDKRKEYFSVASIASATDTSATVSCTDQSRSASENQKKQPQIINEPSATSPKNLTLSIPSGRKFPCKGIKENVPFDEPYIPSAPSQARKRSTKNVPFDEPNNPSVQSQALETVLYSDDEIMAARNSASPVHMRSIESTDSAIFLYNIRSGFDSEFGDTVITRESSGYGGDDSHYIFSDESEDGRNEFIRNETRYVDGKTETPRAETPRGLKLGCCSLIDNADGDDSEVASEATFGFVKDCEEEVEKANEYCMHQTEKTRDFCLSLCEDELRGLTFSF